MGNLSCLSTLWSSSISTPTILTSGQIARPTSQQVEAVQNPDLVGGVVEQSKDPKITNDSLPFPPPSDEPMWPYSEAFWLFCDQVEQLEGVLAKCHPPPMSDY